MINPTRRSLFGAAAVFAAVPAALAQSSSHPDADLIRLCAEHIGNMAAFNASDSDSDDDPAWLAYERTSAAIGSAKPRTIAGMQAKARAAKAEAKGPDGRDDPYGTHAEKWAWDLVRDLLGSVGT